MEIKIIANRKTENSIINLLNENNYKFSKSIEKTNSAFNFSATEIIAFIPVITGLLKFALDLYKALKPNENAKMIIVKKEIKKIIIISQTKSEQDLSNEINKLLDE